MEEGVVEIVLKHNRYWATIPTTGRKKYEIGNQKTTMVEVNKIFFKTFGHRIVEFLPVARGHMLKLTYHPWNKPWLIWRY